MSMPLPPNPETTQARPRLSVIVPAGNSAEVIEQCLTSVRWADELIVVDSFSSDGTLEIAQRYADRILRNEYINSATQKNWAIPQASHLWVLIVDTDERVSPELRQEIEAVIAQPGEYAAYRMPRVNYAFGRPVRYAGYYPDYQVRLFQRDRGRYAPRQAHAHMMIDGAVGTLANPIIHYAHRTMEQTIRGLLGPMTYWEALERYQQGRRANMWQLFLRPPAAFIYRYLYQGGFRDGPTGLVISLLWSFYVGLTYLRLWEMQHPTVTRWWEADWLQRDRAT